MTTPAQIRLMLHRCGLSHAEAARHLGVNHRTIGYWLEGRMAPRPEHWQRLVELCARQDRAAREALGVVAKQRRKLGDPDRVTLRLARSDAEAQELGWPCLGAHLAVLRRVVEWAPAGIEVVPVHPGEDKAADVAARQRA